MPAVAPASALAVSAAVRSVAARAARVTGLLSEALALRGAFPPLAAVAADPAAGALRLTFLNLAAEMKFTAQLPIGAPLAVSHPASLSPLRPDTAQRWGNLQAISSAFCMYLK